MKTRNSLLGKNDWLYTGLDHISRNQLDKEWFTWISWVLLTAGLFALALKTESIFVFFIALISMILLFPKIFCGYNNLLSKFSPNIDRFSDLEEIEDESIRQTLLHVVFAIITFILQIILIIFMANTFLAVLIN